MTAKAGPVTVEIPQDRAGALSKAEGATETYASHRGPGQARSPRRP
ncbi:hypothetical protein [Streptomyces sp. CLV115]